MSDVRKNGATPGP